VAALAKKQAKDQDPKGVFTQQWVPEHGTPDYSAPIVEHLHAAKQARDQLWSLRKDQESKAQARAIFTKHGSRNPKRETRPKSKPPTKNSVNASAESTDAAAPQQAFDF
jgi:deoxyribodipyrimidine photo-lyase